MEIDNLTGYFRKSEDIFPLWIWDGIDNLEDQQHTPLVVCTREGLHACKSIQEVFDYYQENDHVDEKTPVITSWKGKWRSDMFKFQIIDLIQYAGEEYEGDYTGP